MKKLTFIITAAIFLLSTSFCYAKVWQVNNTGVEADFTSIVDAHNDSEVQAGDTLYVHGSGTGYDSLWCSKQLHIVGPGYFLDENPETQAIANEASIKSISFEEGSEYSTVTGITIEETITMNTDHITIQRCRTLGPANSWIYLRGASYTKILQCYIQNEIQFDNAYGSPSSKDVIIKNNIIMNSPALNMEGDWHSSVISNNVIAGDIVNLCRSFFYNNIHYSGAFSESSETGHLNNISYNIGHSDQFGTDMGNQSNVDMNTVFTLSGSSDGYWILKAGSPAIGAGDDGGDCGVFDGDYPYKLSGLPPIPAIYYYKSPAIGSDITSVPVRIKIKSHN